VKWWQKILWPLIKFLGLRKWFAGDAEYPSQDDWRNPFWRLTEHLRVKVEWARYLFDLRIGFKRGGKWKALHLEFWTPVTQNFWNGIFTANIYIVHAHIWGIPMIFPRPNLVIRPLRDWWFETGIGFLFDRGEFGVKFVIMNWFNEGGIDAWDHEEGSV